MLVKELYKALGYVRFIAHTIHKSMRQSDPQYEESRAMLLNATLNQKNAPIHTKSDTQYRPSLKQSRREPRYSINLARLRILPPACTLVSHAHSSTHESRHKRNKNENKTMKTTQNAGQTQGYRTRYQTREDGDSQLNPSQQSNNSTVIGNKKRKRKKEIKETQKD